MGVSGGWGVMVVGLVDFKRLGLMEKKACIKTCISLQHVFA